MAFLVANDKIFKNNIVTLETNSSHFLTTKPYSQGRWYYEFTHISGDNFHLAGFCVTGNPRVYVYPQGSKGHTTISFFDRMSVKGYDCYQSLPLSNYSENHTIGLAFNTFTKLFTVIYQNQTLKFQTVYNTKINKVSPCFYEAVDPTLFTDTISVNLGSKPFQYQIPPNYLPWSFFNTEIKSKILLKSIHVYYLSTLLTK